MEGRRDDTDLSRVAWPHAQEKCQGDTIVIVDFPSTSASNCQQVPWASRATFRMDSEKLIATGSSELIRLLGEDRQRRFRKRHVSVYQTLPKGARYILDLTPDMEGDAMASLVGDLSLPAGVRDWWMSKDRLGVPDCLVSGHDDACNDHESIPLRCERVGLDDLPDGANTAIDTPYLNKKYKITIGMEHVAHCAARDILDYCEIRHRANIIRLLLAVSGYELVLNSAPRVYTIVALAKHLDLVDLVKTDVLAWLVDDRNSSFIDIHPEIALEMAWKMQLSDLVRAPLRILVTERALEPADAPLGMTTKFGRSRVSLSDDISTVVQHATNAVRVRTQEAAAHLFSTNAYSWLQVPAWTTLVELGSFLDADVSVMKSERQPFQLLTEDLLDQYHRIIVSLVNYIRTIIDDAINAFPNALSHSEIDNDRLAYVAGGSTFVNIRSILSSLSREQKLLTPFFWAKLRDEASQQKPFLAWLDHSTTKRAFLDTDMVDFRTKLNHAMGMGLLPKLSAQFPTGIWIDPQDFQNQLTAEVRKTFDDWVPSPATLEAPLYRTTHLALGFVEDEFKFLPLWAGGLDDGTGAVFNDMTVPDTDMGACQPGPTYVTGKTIAPSSTADSDITIVGGGISVQATQSGTDTGLSGSGATGSFVQVSGWGSNAGPDGFHLLQEDTTSLTDALGDIDILSQASKNGEAGIPVATHDSDDIESMAGQPGDLVTDSDTMSLDSDWSQI